MNNGSDFTIKETLRGFDLTFKTTFDLFSYKKIDEGTRFLIDSLDVKKGETCLDLGCGYGAIGMVMAKLNPKGKIYFVDRDFVAFEYTKKNCEINHVENVDIRLSNGFSHLENVQFDLIASNLPTHIAKKSLNQIVSEALSHLNPNGWFTVVTFLKLAPYIERMVKSVFGNCETRNRNKKYCVLMAQKE